MAETSTQRFCFAADVNSIGIAPYGRGQRITLSVAAAPNGNMIGLQQRDERVLTWWHGDARTSYHRLLALAHRVDHLQRQIEMRLDELVQRHCHPLRERDVDEAVGPFAPAFGREHPSYVRDEVVAVAVHCGDAGLTGERERHSASLCQCSARTPPAMSRMLTLRLSWRPAARAGSPRATGGTQALRRSSGRGGWGHANSGRKSRVRSDCSRVPQR